MKTLILAAGLSLALAAPSFAEGCIHAKRNETAQMSVPPAATAQMSTPADAAKVAVEQPAPTGTSPVETATATQTGTEVVKPN